MITVLLLNINVTANATTITGFIQKSDYGFGVFLKNKITSFSRLYKAFCSSSCEQDLTKLAFKH